MIVMLHSISGIDQYPWLTSSAERSIMGCWFSAAVATCWDGGCEWA